MNMSEENTQQTLPLIPAATAIETFRDAGYKSTASAIAEIIDNSIEAEAQNIQILTFEEPVEGAKRIKNKIVTVAIYDDGKGMDTETLQSSLRFGVGTRMNTRSGMGRFGIGLPNASVSQCRHVTVYSWQNGICNKAYLDIDEIKKTKQQDANLVEKCVFPMDVLEYVDGGYDQQSGTLVVWEKCDRLDVARSGTLYKRMEKDLCRIYRHFLDNDNTYGNHVNVSLVTTGSESQVRVLKANDPMYLLVPNTLPEWEGKVYENEATNVCREMVSFDAVYDEEGNSSTVEIHFSMALPEIQNLGGLKSDVGRHYQQNIGISFVRACREIDFGSFGFVKTDTRERWWGCEVRFEPVLDELFGVTNNKQSIRGIKLLDKEDEVDIDDDPKSKLRQKLSQAIANNIATMRSIIEKRNAGTRGKANTQAAKKITQIVNKKFENSKEQTKSEITASAKTEEEKSKEWEAHYKDKNPELLDEEIKKIVAEKVNSKIEIEFDSWPGEQFFTIATRGGTAVVTINQKHLFYQELYEPLKENPSLIDAINLIMMAYARTEEELYNDADTLEKVRSRWGSYIQDLLKELKDSA